MAYQSSNYQLLIEKLDKFIRKYYVNQLIRGVLYSVAFVLVFFLAISLLEYQFYFGKGTRQVLFYSFLGSSALALGYWVVKPLMAYFRLGKVISHEYAASIIGEHFGNVKDKLLNILQLKAQADASPENSLLLAGIDQKTEDIKPVPFQAAIDLQKNRRYLRYALPPLLLLLVILLAAPSMIKDPTRRLLQNRQDFERPAPFHFKIDTEDLKVVQFGNYLLEVEVDGDQLPAEVFINVDNYEYRLKKEGANKFTHTFNNVQDNTDFNLYAAGVTSLDYELEVLKKPNITAFEVQLDYPDYLGRKDETLSNIGDLNVPAGTRLQWIFNAAHTETIEVRFADEPAITKAERFDDELFSVKHRAMRDLSYRLFVSNSQLPKADSIGYALTVIPDLHPEINVESIQDSTMRQLVFFIGEAADDYGLSKLSFNYRIQRHEQEQSEKLVTVPIRGIQGAAARYDYTLDMNQLGLQPGDNVTYYFEVFDNDGVNGPKSARTAMMNYAMPTAEELQAEIEQTEEQIKDDLEKALAESKKIQDELQDIREQLLQEKEVDWQTRKELERLLERQQQLQQQMEQAKQNFEQNRQNQQQLSPEQQRIQEKQDQLQKLFEESLSEEMKELMKQIEELLQEMNKDQALEMMENMEMNDEQLELELDRMLEMYKQLELEQDLQETIDQLEELAEKQEELSEKTENKEAPNDELQKEQEKLNEEFEELQEKMEDIEKQNEELEKPMELGEQNEEQMDSIQEEMEKSQEQLQQQQNNSASQSQKKAASKMKSMAAMMAMQMQQQQEEQLQEDMKALRQLLENLVNLSFDQEKLMNDFGQTTVNTPRFVGLVQQQFKLEDDFGLIQDSLHALSKRVTQIESFVTDKVTEIKRNMRQSIQELEERQVPRASAHQQRTMTNVNDLALMLSETLNQMQQQMSGMMAGNQMCNNPGGQGGAKPGNSPQDKGGSPGQRSVNDALQRMKNALQQGQGVSSKEFAQAAARQAALRNALRQKQAERQQRGEGPDPQLQELIDDMNRAEEDLVNKRLTNEMMQRQQDILSKLLEHENAERQREQDEKRKSESAQQHRRELPPSLQEYLKQRQAEVDMYRAVSPSLKPYYKQLVGEYFGTLRGGQTGTN